MTRTEFSKPTRRDALKRSGGLCEAEGAMYGLDPGQRCNSPLSYGVEFDHLLAASNGGDASLANCICACTRCHAYKTRTHDTPRAAKTVRQQDKAIGIRKPSRMVGSRNSRFKKKIDGTVVER